MQNTLPQEFIDQIKNIYKTKSQNILKTFEKSKPTTFRVNTLKSAREEVIKNLVKEGVITKPAPLPNSYIVTKVKKSLSKTSLFDEGKIYIQELSSMIPPLVLNPKKGDYILDMTAAPGSKTTQLAALSNNKAKILAIEKNKVRFQILKHNIKTH